jgi:hypothetical protein
MVQLMSVKQTYFNQETTAQIIDYTVEGDRGSFKRNGARADRNARYPRCQ